MTRGMLVAVTALVGGFAGLAAHSFAGHKARAAPVTTRTVREVQTQTQPQANSQSEQDDRQTTTQAPPVTTTTAPATTTMAPVVVSGAT